MEWTTVQCAHCQTTYKYRNAPSLAREIRRGIPCPHCYRLQPADLKRFRWRRLGCFWLVIVPFVGGLFGGAGLKVAGILLGAAALSLVLEAMAGRARYKMRAIVLMESGALLDPDENAESLYQRAGHAEPEEAAKLLYRVAALTPKRLEVWTELAQCLAAQRRLDEARSALERALILDPASAQVWQAKAGVSMADDRFDEALRHLDYTLTLAPDEATVWSNRAMVLQRLKRLPEAAESAGRAVELEPSNPVNWLNRARLEEQLGHPDARESYLQFLARTDAYEARHDVLLFRGVDLAVRAEEIRRKLRPHKGDLPDLAVHHKLTVTEGPEGLVAWSAGGEGEVMAPVEALERAAGRGLVLDPGTAGEKRWTAAELADLREDVLLSR